MKWYEKFARYHNFVVNPRVENVVVDMLESELAVRGAHYCPKKPRSKENICPCDDLTKRFTCVCDFLLTREQAKELGIEEETYEDSSEEN